MNSYSKRLLFGVSIVLCFSHNLSAEKIVIKYKTGGSGTVEVLGIEGQSVKLKSTLGNTRIIPLRMLDEDSLIRIISNLNSRIDWTAKPAPRSTVKPGNIPEVTRDRVELFKNKYLAKTVRFSNAKYVGLNSNRATYAIPDELKRGVVVFAISDSRNDLTNGFVADRNQFAELIVELEKGQRIEVVAKVRLYLKSAEQINLTYLVQSIKVLK